VTILDSSLVIYFSSPVPKIGSINPPPPESATFIFGFSKKNRKALKTRKIPKKNVQDRKSGPANQSRNQEVIFERNISKKNSL